MNLERLADLIVDALAPHQDSRIAIAIDGFGCCGKSTLAQLLAQRMAGVILETDDFHLPRGAPPALDSPLSYRRWGELQHAATRLASGQPARFQPMDWDSGGLLAAVEVQPAQVLIIDGIGATALQLPSPVFRIFVDGLARTRMHRVAARDGIEHAGWDHYVAIEREYFERHRPWRSVDLFVLGAELEFANLGEGFARLVDLGAVPLAGRLDEPLRGRAVPQAGNTPVDR